MSLAYFTLLAIDARQPAAARARGKAAGRGGDGRRHEDPALMEAGARARARRARHAPVRRRELAGDYVALTKPRVISLLLLTTLATMFVADPSPRSA